MNKSIHLGWIAAVSLGMAGAASAESETATVSVRSTQINFVVDEAQTAKGANKLFHNIRQAAASVCTTSSNPVGHDLWLQHACEAEAVGKATRALNIAALNEVYGRSTGLMLVARR